MQTTSPGNSSTAFPKLKKLHIACLGFVFCIAGCATTATNDDKAKNNGAPAPASSAPALSSPAPTPFPVPAPTPAPAPFPFPPPAPAPAATVPGGFVPGKMLGGVSTIKNALSMNAYERVTLRGKIVQRLDNELYLLQDDTGSIRLAIGDDRWKGQILTPEDTVEVSGEVYKDWNQVHIDVDRIAKK